MTSFTTSALSRSRALGLGLSFAVLAAPSIASASPSQVEVCHVLGNGSISSIFVNPNAVPALIASGDFLPQTWFIDADGDGYGDAGQSVEACEPPPGYVDNSDDCDDTDPALNLDCSSVNFGNCLAASELTTCDVDLSSGAVSCDNGTPMALYAGANGEYTFRLDMGAWSAVSVSMDLDNPTGYWFNLGNSRTNNGWSGDSSTNTNDSEAQGYNTGMFLYASDFGGSAGLMSTPASRAGPMSASRSPVTVTTPTSRALDSTRSTTRTSCRSTGTSPTGWGSTTRCSGSASIASLPAGAPAAALSG